MKMLKMLCLQTNILLIFLALEFATCSNPIVVQDWLTLTTQVKIGSESDMTCNYKSGYGVIQHVTSGKNALPDEGIWSPDFSNIRIGTTSSSEQNKFRFVQVKGHYGYIEHYSGRIMHPHSTRVPNPEDHTDLIVHGERHSACYFSFDEENDFIMHTGGKRVHPYGGSQNPAEGTRLDLHSHNHNGAKFRMVPNAYPTPTVSGAWILIFAVINPISEQSFNIAYKEGKSMTKQVTEEVYWKTTSSIALAWFESSPELSRYANISDASTWEFEENRMHLIEVSAGQTSITWQYVFFAERLDEEYAFRSSLIEETEDPNNPPDI